ncbi:MAG: hypothetical protein A3H98_10685 [Bacteroidetes bacterium RIFCSPLOWO2_02_FULL_36_8]|nr:MAG: hypothetical protein A3H98_10685 [Bacteroidetes bacterium RIFCSPLOWO2_02_FULL_36_8]OFY69765.1 MAG: hypothetical protein A3G23_11470 [Bacteroidetes bacterium RIFCSPLOWO2_12_FULL_37_12]
MCACINCATQTDKNDNEKNTTLKQVQEIEKNEKTHKTNYTKIGDSIGLIVLKDNYCEKDTIKIYNEDGSLWYKFTYYYDDSDGKFDYPNDEFQPRGFKPDYFVLAMEVVIEDKYGYQVFVNKKIDLKKRIKKETFLQFLTWEEYVLKAFAVRFNNAKNPIHKTSEDESETIIYKQDNFYHPVKVKDEWLQIKWGEENNWSYGWIKWREENRLLIEIYLFA